MKKLIAAAAAVLAVGSFTAGTANAADPSIYDVASTIPTLKAAIDAAKLNDELSDCDAEYTVFAPTQAALDAVPEGTLAALLADPEGALKDLLLYHVADGVYDSAAVLALTSPAELEMLNGDMVTITLSASPLGVEVNESSVDLTTAGVTYDIETCNGVIHLIDAVLIPPADGDMGGDTGSGTTMAMLAAALLGAGLVVTTISRRRVTA